MTNEIRAALKTANRVFVFTSEATGWVEVSKGTAELLVSGASRFGPVLVSWKETDLYLG